MTGITCRPNCRAVPEGWSVRAMVSEAPCACSMGSGADSGSVSEARDGRSATVLAGGASDGFVSTSGADGATSGCAEMMRVLKGRSSKADGATAKPVHSGAPCKRAPCASTTATLKSTNARVRRPIFELVMPRVCVMVMWQFNSERQFPHETRNLPRRLT